MRQSLISLFALMVFGVSQASAGPVRLIDATEMNWETTPEGVAFAALQGDRFHESYQALVKLPSGTISPAHVKSANMYGIVRQGQTAHYARGDAPDAPATIGPGSFYHIPAGLAHVSACVSQDPCMKYLYQDGAFDFLVTE